MRSFLQWLDRYVTVRGAYLIVFIAIFVVIATALFLANAHQDDYINQCISPSQC